MIESAEVKSLVLAVNDDVHHGADLRVGNVVGALAALTKPCFKAFQGSGKTSIKRSVSIRFPQPLLSTHCAGQGHLSYPGWS